MNQFQNTLSVDHGFHVNGLLGKKSCQADSEKTLVTPIRLVSRKTLYSDSSTMGRIKRPSR